MKDTILTFIVAYCTIIDVTPAWTQHVFVDDCAVQLARYKEKRGTVAFAVSFLRVVRLQFEQLASLRTYSNW